MTTYRFYVYRGGILLGTVNFKAKNPAEMAALLEGDYDADFVDWESV